MGEDKKGDDPRRIILEGVELDAYERMLTERIRLLEQVDQYTETIKELAEERAVLERKAEDGEKAQKELDSIGELSKLPSSLRRFFAVIAWVYQENIAKGKSGPEGWDGSTPSVVYMEKAEEEYKEFLQTIVDLAAPERVVEEAADTALAMMITAHVYGVERKKERQAVEAESKG